MQVHLVVCGSNPDGSYTVDSVYQSESAAYERANILHAEYVVSDAHYVAVIPKEVI